MKTEIILRLLFLINTISKLSSKIDDLKFERNLLLEEFKGLQVSSKLPPLTVVK